MLIPFPKTAEELNFPIGCRDPIDLSGYRWNLPIHLMEGEENTPPTSGGGISVVG